MKLELWYPTKPWKLNQGFGENLNPYYASIGLKGHNGLDSWAPDGHVVRASHDGIVSFSGEDGSGGLGIVVRTLEKFEYQGQEVFYKTIYWHLKPGTIKVKAGDEVVVGQEIARADNTGMSTGSHLHFGLKPLLQGEQEWEWYNVAQTNGYLGAIDPTPYFNKYHAEDAVQVIALLTQMKDLLSSFVAYLQKAIRG